VLASNILARRELLRLAAATPLAAKLPAQSAAVRVHSPHATRRWNYDANFPWDHTVELTTEQPDKITERYYDYINDAVIARMFERGLRELTGERSATAAWKQLLPAFQPTHRITLKLNTNNASFNEAITTNRMDQTMPLVNAVLATLIEGLGVPPANITLLDASRWFHPVIMKGRCRFPGVRWVDSKSADRWDPAECVTFTQDHPAPGGRFCMPRDYTQANHIINMCLLKAHGCGVTGATKSHFGSIPSPKWLHEGMGQKSYIADLCATPSIRNKVRLNLVDALFGNWGGPVWAPRPWRTFSEPSPNSLFLSRDPVALDAVMLDHMRAELKAQGTSAPRHVVEWVETSTYLDYAMNHHQLGVSDRKRIDYRVLEL